VRALLIALVALLGSDVARASEERPTAQEYAQAMDPYLLNVTVRDGGGPRVDLHLRDTHAWMMRAARIDTIEIECPTERETQ
jgi:hypothetical protein